MKCLITDAKIEPAIFGGLQPNELRWILETNADDVAMEDIFSVLSSRFLGGEDKRPDKFINCLIGYLLDKENRRGYYYKIHLAKELNVKIEIGKPGYYLSGLVEIEDYDHIYNIYNPSIGIVDKNKMIRDFFDGYTNEI